MNTVTVTGVDRYDYVDAVWDMIVSTYSPIERVCLYPQRWIDTPCSIQNDSQDA